MIEKNVSAASMNDLKKLFQNPKNAYKPYIYIPIDGNNALNTPEKLTKLISGYIKSGFGGIVPFSYKSFTVQPFSEEYYKIYRHIQKEAKSNSLAVGYMDDTYLMRDYISALGDAKKNVVCNVLVKYDYACTEGQVLKRKLRVPETLMSLVAVNDDDLTILDLRQYIKDGDTLEWTVPDGNWNIEEFVCEPDVDSNAINLMDYEAVPEDFDVTGLRVEYKKAAVYGDKIILKSAAIDRNLFVGLCDEDGNTYAIVEFIGE